MAAVAAVGENAGHPRADLRLDFGQNGRKRVTVVGVAGQRLHVGDELAALGTMKRGGERDLDAELVRPMRLALADTFDLGGVRRTCIDVKG